MRLLSWLFKILFIVSLPLLFISIAFHVMANSEWFYERGFDTYNVKQTTGLERSELVKGGKALIAYFNSAEEKISVEVQKDGTMIPLFNEREVAHLKDVKDLYTFNGRVGEITGLYILAYALVSASLSSRNVLRRLAQLVFQGSILTLGLIIAVGIGTAIDFEPLFLQFHLLAFSNDFWMLDPSRDRLIMMFPYGFWVDFVLAVTAIIAIQGLVAGGVAYGYLRKRQRNVAKGVRMASH